MAKRLRHSRWRRMPGVFRVGQQKPPDTGQDLQRLTLYLPWSALDKAEALAMRAGVETIQRYCEGLLARAIEAEHAREHRQEVEARRVPLASLDAIANDPEYLAELTASASSRDRAGPERGGPTDMIEPEFAPDPEGPPARPSPESSPAAEVVLRHAALIGDELTGLLATLRRGEPIDAASAQELLGALRELEVLYRGAQALDRRIAYALHRLAFEGQVLITDAWPGAPVDEGTVDVLRIVQEAVDRVLSGEDIRYFAPGHRPEGAP